MSTDNYFYTLSMFKSSFLMEEKVRMKRQCTDINNDSFTSISIAATWVGGGFVVGIAASVYDPTRGLIWALIPLQFFISFTIGKCVINTN